MKPPHISNIFILYFVDIFITSGETRSPGTELKNQGELGRREDRSGFLSIYCDLQSSNGASLT